MAASPFGKLPGGIGNIGKMLDKAMADAKEAEVELSNARVEAIAGGGAVKVVLTGKGDFVSITISKQIVDPNDIETLEVVISLAMKDAIERANTMRTERLSSAMPGGLGAGGFPGLF